MHRLRLPDLWCAVTLLLAGGAWPAQATLVTYNSLADWQAATSSYQTVNFEVSPNATSYSTAAGYSPNANIQFIGQSSPNYFLWIVDTVVNPGNSYGTGDVLKGPLFAPSNPNRRIDVNLNPGVTAFSLNLMTYLNGSSTAPPQDFKIQFSTGDVISPIHTATQPTTTFFGVTSTEPITWAQVYLITGTVGSDVYPLIDNVSYGTAAPVVIDPPPGDTSETPEPVTYLLVGSGLIGLSLAGKRRRRNSSG